jgi:hypothetical protein
MICNNSDKQINKSLQNTSFRDYVNYTIIIQCGITKIKVDENKIDEYYQKYIKEFSEKNLGKIKRDFFIEKLSSDLKKINSKKISIFKKIFGDE